jgi:hypothetical protein
LLSIFFVDSHFLIRQEQQLLPSLQIFSYRPAPCLLTENHFTDGHLGDRHLVKRSFG